MNSNSLKFSCFVLYSSLVSSIINTLIILALISWHYEAPSHSTCRFLSTSSYNFVQLTMNNFFRFLSEREILMHHFWIVLSQLSKSMKFMLKQWMQIFNECWSTSTLKTSRSLTCWISKRIMLIFKKQRTRISLNYTISLKLISINSKIS